MSYIGNKTPELSIETQKDSRVQLNEAITESLKVTPYEDDAELLQLLAEQLQWEIKNLDPTLSYAKDKELYSQEPEISGNKISNLIEMLKEKSQYPEEVRLLEKYRVATQQQYALSNYAREIGDQFLENVFLRMTREIIDRDHEKAEDLPAKILLQALYYKFTHQGISDNSVLITDLSDTEKRNDDIDVSERLQKALELIEEHTETSKWLSELFELNLVPFNARTEAGAYLVSLTIR